MRPLRVSAVAVALCAACLAAGDDGQDNPAETRLSFLGTMQPVASSKQLRRFGQHGERRTPRPRLRLVTFLNKLDRRFSFLQVSAEAHSLHPEIIGMGLKAWWPDGLGVKINALRRFVGQSADDDDVLIFADAFDTMLFGDETEIVDRFLDIEESTNKSLVFNAEFTCFPNQDGLCDRETYPKGAFQFWRFLNSGLMVGRGRAFKRMLTDPVPDIIRGSDQAWYQGYFHSHRDAVHLDTRCELVCAIWGLDNPEEFGTAWTQDDRVYIPVAGSLPPLVHFVSVSHWTVWQRGRPTSVLHQVFQHLYPEASENLMDGWWIGAYLGSTHDIELYTGPGFWNFMRWYLCFRCNVLGSPHGECHYMTSGRCARSLMVTVPLVLLVLLVLLRSCLRYCPRLASLPDIPAPAVSSSRHFWLQALCRRAWQWLRMRLHPLLRRSAVAPA